MLPVKARRRVAVSSVSRWSLDYNDALPDQNSPSYRLTGGKIFGYSRSTLLPPHRAVETKKFGGSVGSAPSGVLEEAPAVGGEMTPCPPGRQNPLPSKMLVRVVLLLAGFRVLGSASARRERRAPSSCGRWLVPDRPVFASPAVVSSAEGVCARRDALRLVSSLSH